MPDFEKTGILLEITMLGERKVNIPQIWETPRGDHLFYAYAGAPFADRGLVISMPPHRFSSLHILRRGDELHVLDDDALFATNLHLKRNILANWIGDFASGCNETDIGGFIGFMDRKWYASRQAQGALVVRSKASEVGYKIENLAAGWREYQLQSWHGSPSREAELEKAVEEIFTQHLGVKTGRVLEASRMNADVAAIKTDPLPMIPAVYFQLYSRGFGP
jgi:hypothetical protein